MSLLSDLKVIYHIICAQKGLNYERWLEDFYSHQAPLYDDFREKFLHGRERMMSLLPLQAGDNLIDMGGGTGKNIELLEERVADINSITIVDLCQPLLKIAQKRIDHRNWQNVCLVQADATNFKPHFNPVDVITFSYSLTMMPMWFQAIDHAFNLLKPGGILGLVDFYVSCKWTQPNRIRHSALSTLFWQGWFAQDNVFLSSDHIPYLENKFKCLHLEELKGRVPYLFGLKAPYYIFIGKKEI